MAGFEVSTEAKAALDDDEGVAAGVAPLGPGPDDLGHALGDGEVSGGFGRPQGGALLVRQPLARAHGRLLPLAPVRSGWVPGAGHRGGDGLEGDRDEVDGFSLRLK